MSDLLDKWQRSVKPTVAKDDEVKTPVASSAPSEQTDDEEKRPTRYRLGSIELRPARGLCSLPSYAQLIDVLFDGEPTSFIALIFLHQVVVITGRNLSSIVAGLRMRTQWVIEQHQESKHGVRAKNEPVVEHMEFITEEIPAAVAALRAGKTPQSRQQTFTGVTRASA